jgi:hypothetical protein
LGASVSDDHLALLAASSPLLEEVGVSMSPSVSERGELALLGSGAQDSPGPGPPGLSRRAGLARLALRQCGGPFGDELVRAAGRARLRSFALRSCGDSGDVTGQGVRALARCVSLREVTLCGLRNVTAEDVLGACWLQALESLTAEELSHTHTPSGVSLAPLLTRCTRLRELSLRHFSGRERLPGAALAEALAELGGSLQQVSLDSCDYDGDGKGLCFGQQRRPGPVVVRVYRCKAIRGCLVGCPWVRAATPEVLLLPHDGPACKVPRGGLAGDHGGLRDEWRSQARLHQRGGGA